LPPLLRISTPTFEASAFAETTIPFLYFPDLHEKIKNEIKTNRIIFFNINNNIL
jgi:hypothetical protein